jgi:adenine/guanine phosphoribosyltransferase-like PRPP-binding protein
LFAEKAGGEVVETACIVELPILGGRAKLGGVPLHILVTKDVE